MGRIIGIDLGTTNSVAAVIEGGEPTVIPLSKELGNLTPSVVAIDNKGERRVGTAARRQAANNPKNTVFSIKRFMGRKFEEPEVQDAAKLVSYKVSEASNGDVRVRMNNRDYSPPEISAMVLQKMKADAEDYLEGETVDQAVITVPAHFDDAQRHATKDAGKIAGLEVLRIINEPTAASLAYGLGGDREGMIAVYDMGGGTFDISILKIANGIFEVKSTYGHTFLGGDNFDERIIDEMAEQFKQEHGIDLRDDSEALWRLKEAAEEAKIELSTTFNADINLPFITFDADGPKHLNMSLSRAKLEDLVTDDDYDLIQETIECCKQALKDAELSIDDIDEVLLAGGMTQMPAIREAVKNFFGKEPTKRVNPAEVVANGAAIQAGMLDGDIKGIALLDVTPLTLSTETEGDIATPMIKRNTTIPTKKVKNFTTVADNQTRIMFHVIQGERPMASDNRSLGRFILDGILPAPRGVPQIEKTFEIDANGILNVSAKDLATGREQAITIFPDSGLSDAEIERAKAEAEQFAREDAERKERSEAVNQAESTIYQAKKLLRNYAEKLPRGGVQRAEEKIEALQQARETGSISEIKAATEALTQQLQALGGQMYEDAPPPEGAAAGDEDVIDAEFTET